MGESEPEGEQRLPSLPHLGETAELKPEDFEAIVEVFRLLDRWAHEEDGDVRQEDE